MSGACFEAQQSSWEKCHSSSPPCYLTGFGLICLRCNVAFHGTQKEITQTAMRAKPLRYKLRDHSSPNVLGHHQAWSFLQGSPGRCLCSLLPWMMLLTSAWDLSQKTLPVPRHALWCSAALQVKGQFGPESGKERWIPSVSISSSSRTREACFLVIVPQSCRLQQPR